jgi:hypothetical protein
MRVSRATAGLAGLTATAGLVGPAGTVAMDTDAYGPAIGVNT